VAIRNVCCHRMAISHSVSQGDVSGMSIVSSISLSLNCTYGESRDGSVGKRCVYGLDDRGSRVRFPVVAGNFPLHHPFQNVSRAHPASYPMGTIDSFPGGKAAGA
jgi:hypothetical protein